MCATYNELAIAIQESIDQLDFNLSDQFNHDSNISCGPNSSPQVENGVGDNDSEPPDDFNGCNDKMLPSAGDRISIIWPLEQKSYPGFVKSVNSDGTRVIHYDDDDLETLDLKNEIWNYCENTMSANLSGFVQKLHSNEQEAVSYTHLTLPTKA